MWNTVEYAAVGRGHIKGGMPCQDKVRTYRNGQVTVISLADGAGSARLSHFGAEAVLQSVCRDLGDHFDEFQEENASAIRRRIYTDIQDGLNGVQEKYHCPLNDLSSTLLAAAVCGSRYFIVHIGDGVIGYLKDGKVRVATAPDNGNHINETFFTTSPSVISHMRIIRGENDGIGGFVLMSDGTAHTLYESRKGKLSQGILRIMQMAVLCPQGSMKLLLQESFQESIINRTYDDCSISILADTKAFPDYFTMSEPEKLDLLQMNDHSRNKRKRLRRTGEILDAASGGASAYQIARRINVKPKDIHRKLDLMVSLGLLEKDQGVYSSAH